ncbi:MAG TPA: DUF3857 and transglutaminase domain-containing protein [bacterium]|nr:DUF3857 and transglutaminase domain-containing protein [bacterium]
MGLGKRVLYALAVFIFQAYITGCAAGFQDIRQTQKDYGIEKLPSAEEYPQHEAVIVLESHKIDVSIDNNFDVFTIEDVHVVKRIFRNVENHAEVEITLGYGEKLKSIQARAITSTGQILELEKKEFLHSKGSSDGSVFYSDDRTTRFTFRGVDKGSIVEYKYRIQKDYPFQMDVWYVQGSLPILRNEYKLFVPTILLDNNWNWFFKSYNYDIGLPKIEKAGISANKTLDSKNTYTWLVQNVPAFEREPRMNSYYHHAGHVRFAPSYWNSWNAIADWYYKKLFLPQLIVTPQISEKAQSLIANVADEKSKVQRLSDYVKKIRYTAIELGIGGIRPNTPQTVYDRQYGDCKDKATLLIAMLKSVGITAHPVLVRTANSGFVDAQFPSWNFNHMIVKIALSGGKTIWTDPTSETSQFGFLPWSDEDIDVFVLYPDGTGMIEHTPTSSHTNNLTDVHIQGEAIGDMGMKFEIKIDFFGNDYSYYLYRLRDMSQNELENFSKHAF